jgi:mRNA interferase RelE/StbE
MEPYNIQFKRSAQKDLRKLETVLISRILNAVESLSIDPTPRNSKKLKGVENIYRIRVGKYRIVYEVDKSHNVVTVYYIRHRDDVYRHI